MEDAKNTQMGAKDQDGFLASLHSLISSITSENNPKEQGRRFKLYMLGSEFLISVLKRRL